MADTALSSVHSVHRRQVLTTAVCDKQVQLQLPIIRLLPRRNIVDRGGAEVDKTFSRGDDLSCHPVKNVIYVFYCTECPNFPHNFNITLLVTLRTERHFQ